MSVPDAPCLLDFRPRSLTAICRRCGYRHLQEATYRYKLCYKPHEQSPLTTTKDYHISCGSDSVPAGVSGSQEGRQPVYNDGAGGRKW